MVKEKEVDELNSSFIDPLLHLSDIEVMVDNLSFINDSLFCEWGYIINLDNETFEIYKGFQKSKPSKNRYSDGKSRNEGYYPCEMAKEIPFSELKDFDLSSL